MIFLKRSLTSIFLLSFLVLSSIANAAPELIFEESSSGVKAILSEEESSLIEVRIIEHKGKPSGALLRFSKSGDFRGLNCDKSTSFNGTLKSIENGKYTIEYYHLTPSGRGCVIEGRNIEYGSDLDKNFRLTSFSVGASLEKPFVVDGFPLKQNIQIYLGKEKLVEGLLQKTPYQGKKFFIVNLITGISAQPSFAVLFREPVEAFGHSFKEGTILVYRQDLVLHGTVTPQEITYINKIPCIGEINLDKFGNILRCRVGEDFKYRDFYIPKNTWLWFQDYDKKTSGFLDIERINCLYKDTKIRGKNYKKFSDIYFEEDGSLREVKDTGNCANYDTE